MSTLVKAIIGGGLAAAVYWYAPSVLETDLAACFQAVVGGKSLKPIAIVLVSALGVAALVCGVAVLALSSMYGGLIAQNNVNIDRYVRQQPTTFQRAQVVLLHYLNVGTHVADRKTGLELGMGRGHGWVELKPARGMVRARMCHSLA
jgi:hypothetical protein